LFFLFSCYKLLLLQTNLMKLLFWLLNLLYFCIQLFKFIKNPILREICYAVNIAFIFILNLLKYLFIHIFHLILQLFAQCLLILLLYIKLEFFLFLHYFLVFGRKLHQRILIWIRYIFHYKVLLHNLSKLFRNLTQTCYILFVISKNYQMVINYSLDLFEKQRLFHLIFFIWIFLVNYHLFDFIYFLVKRTKVRCYSTLALNFLYLFQYFTFTFFMRFTIYIILIQFRSIWI